MEISKNFKIRFYDFSLTSGVSKFQPSGTILKNDLEISENWFFDLEKIKISKKMKISFNVFHLKSVVSKFQPSITILKKWPWNFRKLPQKRSKNENFKKRKKVPLDNLEIHIGFKFDPYRLKITPCTLMDRRQTDDSQTDRHLDPIRGFFLHFLHQLISVL